MNWIEGLSWRRALLPAFILFEVFWVGMALLGIWAGLIEYARYGICVLFFGGAICSVMGYYRYIAPGPTISALLALLIGKSVIFSVIGGSFFLIAYSGSGSVEVNAGLLSTYAGFAAAGAAKMFLGLFVIIGAGRGWIGREVYKNPLHREGKLREQDAERRKDDAVRRHDDDVRRSDDDIRRHDDVVRREQDEERWTK